MRNGQTGTLVDATPAAMAAAIATVADDRALRQTLSTGARRVAEREFSHAAFAAGLAANWRAVWGEEP